MAFLADQIRAQELEARNQEIKHATQLLAEQAKEIAALKSENSSLREGKEEVMSNGRLPTPKWMSWKVKLPIYSFLQLGPYNKWNLCGRSERLG